MNGRGRIAFAYVVGVDGSSVTLNLNQAHRGLVVETLDGPVAVLQIGARFGIRHGTFVLVAEVSAVTFVESAAAHRAGIGTTVEGDEPLRQLQARVIGTLERSVGGDHELNFARGTLLTPALGAEAFPLARGELMAVISQSVPGSLEIGIDADTQIPIRMEINKALARHIAVVGGTGQGKSCFTAAILQSMLKQYGEKLRCVLFDVSGEYRRAFSNLDPNDPENEALWKLKDGIKVTQIGEEAASHPVGVERYRIPYPAIGREGLEALLLPSERAQRPALRFALESLAYVEWNGDGVAIKGASGPQLFDDCRMGDARLAQNAVEELRKRIAAESNRVANWPPLRSLGPLIADRAAIERNNQGTLIRSSFLYSGVSPLIRRVQAHCEDPAFRQVINIDGGGAVPGNGDPLAEERTKLVKSLFPLDDSGVPRVHILDLHLVPHDLLPYILGGLLHALLAELFQRGPGKTKPMLLVLEEAHHYIRRTPAAEPEGATGDLLAYERLAKEGRKFGVSLWLSTQRPSELSETVLAQCGTWFCLRLTAETDLGRVRHASEWADRTIIERIVSLPRQQAIAFGAALPVSVHLKLPEADPLPDSRDPKFYSE